MSSQRVDMGQGNVLSVLIRIGAPAMISMFFQNLYGLVDTVFVARLGTIPLAAFSLCVPVLYLALGMGKGISVGMTALMSHARGAGDVSKARNIALATLPLALCIVGPFCLLHFETLNKPLFGLFGIHGQVLVEVDRFMFWLAFLFPVMSFTMICEGVYQSYGNAMTPMKAMIIGNVLNICLDPLFIFTFKMGIAGASLASLTGWSLAGLIMFAGLRREGLDTPWVLCSARLRRAWKNILAQSAPVTFSMLVIPVSLIGLNVVLASFGPAYVGAWNLSSRMEQMLILPLYGLSCALTPFVAFNLGRCDSRRIQQGVGVCIRACYIVLIPVGGLLWFLAPEIIGLFRPAPEIVTLAGFTLRVALLGVWLSPFEIMMMGLAQGVKRPQYPLMTNIIRMLFLRIPLAFAFGHLWGGTGAFISHPVSLAISGLICCFLIRRLLQLVCGQCQAGQDDTTQRMDSNEATI